MSRQAIVGMLRSDPHDHELFKLQLIELEALTKALGYEVVERFTQINVKSKARYLIGSGKVDELSKEVESRNVELVVFYNQLTSKQKLNLSLALNCEVIDRYELTLRIFEEMASDRMSKLQVELARERKLYPFYQLQAEVKYSGLDRQPPWAGTGEFAFHSKIKGVQKRIGKLRREIQGLASEKIRQMKERRKLGTKMICVAGYYNAGKTTLFNLLTGEKKVVGDRPFKTLSSKYQRLQSGRNDAPLLIDTIGFVVGLDPALIKSFELNLMDMNEADLLLFMIGVDDDPGYLFQKLKFGLHLLQEIGVEGSRTMLVLNKLDLLSDEEFDKVVSKLKPLLDQYDWASISAKTGRGVNELIEKTLLKAASLPNRKEAQAPSAETYDEALAVSSLAANGANTSIGSVANTSKPTVVPDTQDWVASNVEEEDEEEIDKPPSAYEARNAN